MYTVIKNKLLYMYIVFKIKLLRVKGQLSPNGGQAMAWLAWPVTTGLPGLGSLPVFLAFPRCPVSIESPGIFA